VDGEINKENEKKMRWNGSRTWRWALPVERASHPSLRSLQDSKTLNLPNSQTPKLRNSQTLKLEEPSFLACLLEEVV
jgi:hypothetical protein